MLRSGLLGKHILRRASSHLYPIRSNIRPFSKNKNQNELNSNNNDIEEAVVKGVKEGAKYATSTFVTVLAEKIAFYVVVGGFLSISAYLFPYQSVKDKMVEKYECYKREKKQKYQLILQEKQAKLSEKIENIENSANDMRNNEKIQSVIEKSKTLKKETVDKLNKLDKENMKENLELEIEKVSKKLQKHSEDSNEKLDDWKRKAMEKTQILKGKVKISKDDGTEDVVSSNTDEAVVSLARNKFNSFKGKYSGKGSE